MPPPRLSPSPPIFVNRDEPLAHFSEFANAIPRHGIKILSFHGVGGQGKTALLQKIFEQVNLKTEGAYHFLKPAWIDFSSKNLVDQLSLLLRIRNSLAHHGVEFPVFDLALATYWEIARSEQPFPNLENAWLARITDATSSIMPEAFMTLREMAEQTAETIPGLGFLISRGTRYIIEKHKRKYLEITRSDLEFLYTESGIPKLAWEIEALLHWFLAQDLNAYIKANEDARFLLLINDYEMIFPKGDAETEWRTNHIDRCLRNIAAETDGVMLVTGSRRPLPWGQDDSWAPQFTDASYYLPGLSPKYADEWLQKVPIKSDSIRSAIIDSSREYNTDEAALYPLLLQLQIEHWKNLQHAEQEPSQNDFRFLGSDSDNRAFEITERLLKGYEDSLKRTLQHLSMARRFDQTTFDHVVDSFGTSLAYDWFNDLRNLSFITEVEPGWLVMHKVVSEAIAATSSPELRDQSTRSLLAHFERRATPNKIQDFDQNSLIALEIACDLRLKLGIKGYVAWLFPFSRTVVLSSRHAADERLWRNALTYCQEEFGENHPDTAVCYGNIAFNLDAQDRYQEAKAYHWKSLILRMRGYGKRHPYTASSYDNLAANLENQGRFRIAEVLRVSALEIRRTRLGEGDLATVMSFNNVAKNFEEQIRYVEAEPLYRQALNILTDLFDPFHPEAGRACNNLARNLKNQDKLAESEGYYRRAIRITEHNYGKNHPNTALIYSNLAELLNSRPPFTEAEELLKTALKIYQEFPEQNLLDIAMVQNNLGINYGRQQRYRDAEIAHRDAVSNANSVVGPVHHLIALYKLNLSGALICNEKSQEAIKVSKDAIQMAESTLGVNSPTVKLYQKELQKAFTLLIQNDILRRGGTYPNTNIPISSEDWDFVQYIIRHKA